MVPDRRAKAASPGLHRFVRCGIQVPASSNQQTIGWLDPADPMPGKALTSVPAQPGRRLRCLADSEGRQCEVRWLHLRWHSEIHVGNRSVRNGKAYPAGIWDLASNHRVWSSRPEE